MNSSSLILIVAVVFFLVTWAFIGWLKFREHHHILQDEPRQKTHITGFFRRHRKSNRQ
jgi:hypothetical protein